LRDLTKLKTYIIDSDNPHEVDDAISLETKENNTKKLWIHISNPCKLFPLDSSIDNDARKKNSSIYLTSEYYPMLPKSIIVEANLKQNKVSNTISASIDFNENGSINKYEIVEAIIKPKYQLTYEDTNEIIELEPKEEKEIIEIKNLLLKSINYRKSQGAIIFENPLSKIIINNGEIIIAKIDKSLAQMIISEAMILMGYVTSLYLFDNNLAGAYRSQRINCNPKDILFKYKDSEIKYILLKQYIGKSFITLKPSRHESLGLKMYVQCTSPLRRYLDLVIQRQVYNKINNLNTIESNIVSELINYSKKRQLEINNIYKNDKLNYLTIFFNKQSKSFYKIIFVKWINLKRNIALVYFPDYSLEILIILFVSVDIYCNKLYKVKYNRNNKDLLEFSY